MILRKKKLCNCGCGVEGYIFSNGKLKSCWARSQPQKIRIKKITQKKINEKKIKSIETQKLHEWFTQLWDKTEDARGYCYCYETNKPMHRTFYRNNTCCYHHILEKGIDKFKKYSMEEWNIVIILPEIHNQVHSNIDKTPRIKNLTIELKSKY